jgi:hypothetical protein
MLLLRYELLLKITKLSKHVCQVKCSLLKQDQTKFIVRYITHINDLLRFSFNQGGSSAIHQKDLLQQFMHNKFKGSLRMEVRVRFRNRGGCCSFVMENICICLVHSKLC